MNEKIKTFFDSKWFNTIVSFLSIYIIADIIVDIRATGQFKFMLIIWLVIAYHFISASYKAWKEDNTN